MASRTSAAVTLRAADGSRLRDRAPVTAATVGEHAPDPGAVSRTESWFREHGFEVDGTVANTFSITAAPATFTAIFGADPDDVDELPTERLPAPIRAGIDRVVTSRIDFGPTSY